jgi:hypothetical protein
VRGFGVLSKTKEPGSIPGSTKDFVSFKQKGIKKLLFGGLAVIVTFVTLDPWLCVTGFHRVCHYRRKLLIQ